MDIKLYAVSQKWDGNIYTLSEDGQSLLTAPIYRDGQAQLSTEDDEYAVVEEAGLEEEDVPHIAEIITALGGSRMILRQFGVVPTYLQEVLDITEKAKEAFWGVIAENYPTCPGDLSPETTLAFDRVIDDTVHQWLGNHREPMEGDQPHA